MRKQQAEAGDIVLLYGDESEALIMNVWSGWLAGGRPSSFRMSEPDRLTHDDKSFGSDTRDLILRIIVVAFLAVLFWHTVIAAGRP